MPQTKSAKKALRSSKRKQEFNTARKWKLKKSLKELRKGIQNGAKDIEQTVAKVYSALDKAVKTNLIHKKRADRKKSRVAKMVAKAQGTEDKSVARTKTKKSTSKKPVAKKAPAKKAVAKKTTAKKDDSAKAKATAAKPAAKKKAPAKKTATKKAPAKKAPAKKAE